ncbi:UNVERIFIED_CONTAM: hypothetical protein K2H54_026759 [Gekko kuhli]
MWVAEPASCQHIFVHVPALTGLWWNVTLLCELLHTFNFRLNAWRARKCSNSWLLAPCSTRDGKPAFAVNVRYILGHPCKAFQKCPLNRALPSGSLPAFGWRCTVSVFGMTCPLQTVGRLPTAITLAGGVFRFLMFQIPVRVSEKRRRV